MKKISKQPKNGTQKKIASFGIISLLLNVVMTSVLLAPSEDVLGQGVEQVCENKPDSYVSEDDDEYKGNVLINELMWMGTSVSTADEWIELRNMTPIEINFNNTPWSIYKNDSRMLVISSGILKGCGYFLVSNNSENHKFTNGESVLNITPDFIDKSVSLSDSSVQYKLYDTENSEGNLIDTADDGSGKVLAGEYTPENNWKSMSRRTAQDGTLAENWCTAQTRVNWDAKTPEFGTPGAENICNRISGYKFNDVNGNGTWDKNESDSEPGLNEWIINLYGNLITITSTVTDVLGYYEFKNLLAGTYFVKEEIKNKWQQTTPVDPDYFEIDLTDNPISDDINFGNQLISVCGNKTIEDGEMCDDGNIESGDGCSSECQIENTASISGCKYDDENNNSKVDEKEGKLSGWEVQLIGCPYSSEGDFLPKTSINENPQEGEVGYCSVIKTTTTTTDGCYSFEGLSAGDYGVNEVDQENWTQTFPTNGMFYSFNLTDGEAKTDVDFLNHEETTPPECSGEETQNCYGGPGGTAGVGICQAGIQTCVDGNWSQCSGQVTPRSEICGNGIDEDCNGSDAGCGGSGPIPKPTIIITNEKVSYLGSGSALVTWTTNIETTRQVAYGDNSITLLGAVPKYGYDSVNEESDNMTKNHSVTIDELTDGIPYYFRPIADRPGSTGEKVGIEVYYQPGEVKGVTDPVVPEVEECNYLFEYIKFGKDNNPVEVQKLESFLNIFESESLAINGIYEQVDFDAVSRFQEKYFEKVLSPWNHDSATGYVYITTKKRINEIYCEREFPLTKEQAEEVARYDTLFGIRAPSAEQPAESFDIETGAGATTTTPESGIESTEGENEGTEGPQIELGNEKESGEVAGTTDEVNADNGEGEVEEINSETEEEVVYADSGYSNLYFWIPVILLLIIIAIIYYVTKMKKGGNDAGSSTE
ncbi:MAG: SdrD B-like domain-containing protein [Patescibacteria group bacterium]|nr:SdrD B-like domain-containing protein [Patescibacteria group bacterium]